MKEQQKRMLWVLFKNVDRNTCPPDKYPNVIGEESNIVRNSLSDVCTYRERDVKLL